MKKDTMRAVIVIIVALVVYNIIAFAIPFVHTAAFWFSYCFTMIAFAVTVDSIYVAFFKNPDAKSRFYGFPIARIGVLYGAAQLIVSVAVMTLAKWIPWWIPVVVYAVGLGIAIIGLVSAETVAEEIVNQDAKLKKDVSLMRTLESKVNQIASCSDDTDLQKLVDEFRYSDPVSNDSLSEIESEISLMVDQLCRAVAVEDKESVFQLCKKITAVLSERNRLCKLNK